MTDATSIPSLETVAQLLSQVAERAKPHFIATFGNNAQRGLALTTALRSETEFLEAVGSTSEFGSLRNGWVTFEGFGHSFDPHALPALLVRLTVDGESPSAVIAKAVEFASLCTTDGSRFFALTGVTVDADIDLGAGLTLVPWSQVPDSRQKHHMGEAEGLTPRATCAIRQSLPEQRVLFSSAMESGHLVSGDRVGFARTLESAEDLVRSLSLLSTVPVAILGSWAHPNNYLFRNMIGSGMQLLPPHSDMRYFAGSVTPHAVSEATVKTAYGQFLAFRSKPALRIAVDRIGSALRAASLTEKAIDVGIALEVLALHDSNEGELVYRMSLRGTKFLGGDDETQAKRFRLLKSAYKLRSNAVHTGTVTQSEENTATLDQAHSTAVLIARKLLERGQFPEWEKEFILTSSGSE